jgi:hypothetical protein
MKSLRDELLAVGGAVENGAGATSDVQIAPPFYRPHTRRMHALDSARREMSCLAGKMKNPNIHRCFKAKTPQTHRGY